MTLWGLNKMECTLKSTSYKTTNIFLKQIKCNCIISEIRQTNQLCKFTMPNTLKIKEERAVMLKIYKWSANIFHIDSQTLEILIMDKLYMYSVKHCMDFTNFIIVLDLSRLHKTILVSIKLVNVKYGIVLILLPTTLTINELFWCQLKILKVLMIKFKEGNNNRWLKMFGLLYDNMPILIHSLQREQTTFNKKVLLRQELLYWQKYQEITHLSQRI